MSEKDVAAGAGGSVASGRADTIYRAKSERAPPVCARCAELYSSRAPPSFTYAWCKPASKLPNVIESCCSM